ncbi:MAG: hypothetical protein ACRD9S_09820 [Pyrinomonadaceae bacterium]
MYCPQCGTESSEGLQYCRSCGANLKVIGKAVSLSEAIARSDRGPLPKIKEMMKNLKIEHVSEDISRALDQMNKEIVHSSEDAPKPPKFIGRKKKTAAERREKHLTTGAVSLFSGVGLAIFLYYLTAALVLKLPPDAVAKVPFEIEPVVRMIWLVGLMPALSGFGHLVAGIFVRPDPPAEIEPAKPVQALHEREPIPYAAPVSVTERTTNLLEHEVREGRRS